MAEEKSGGPVSKEELGRATWTFLHTLAARYPDNPTRQQKKDVKELMAILTRMYPCKDCADHFKKVLSENPVQAGSHTEFSMWLCQVHNVVNRSLDKPIFPCERVEARWGKSECPERECDVLEKNWVGLLRTCGKEYEVWGYERDRRRGKASDRRWSSPLPNLIRLRTTTPHLLPDNENVYGQVSPNSPVCVTGLLGFGLGGSGAGGLGPSGLGLDFRLD
uniref:Sulfhydryl oxidase n=1 Tax=Cannabis sativa TaxID=3483 RepID=A0A803NNR2_CANSA